jgi:hypothetical protein
MILFSTPTAKMSYTIWKMSQMSQMSDDLGTYGLKHTILFSTYYFPTFFFFFYIPSKNSISFTYLISFPISCLPLFQISFYAFMPVCSRFVSVSLHCHRMWSVVRFTAQKRHSGLGSLSITAEWVALVYPVRKRLMTTCSRQVIVLVWCGLHSFMVVVEFFHFSCCSCSCVSFIHFIKSCGGYVSVCCVVGCFVSWYPYVTRNPQ